MERIRTLILAIVLCAGATLAADPVDYTEFAGQRVTTFENPELNYRLDLAAGTYTYVDFTGQVPEASFAALRFGPNAFALVIVEIMGPGMTARDYADVVLEAMKANIAAEEQNRFKGSSDIGEREERGMDVFQRMVYAEMGAVPITYVLSTYVHGSRAYQLLTFASNIGDEEVLAEANALLAGFSIVDPAQIASHRDAGDVRDYRSATFGYRFRATDRRWYPWPDVAETSEGADFGALGLGDYGAVVLPVCWEGARPTDTVLYRVMMQQFSEDYPSAFITREEDVEKHGATGKLLYGTDAVDDELFAYYQWIVANDRCSYTLAVWGPADDKNVEKRASRIWDDFEITDQVDAVDGEYRDDAERKANAYLLNAIGLHYFEARSYRDAFRHFEHANALSPTDQAYLINATRSLVEIGAYREAVEWFGQRAAPFAGNNVVKSWDAWLAYQTDEPEKALRLFDELFDDGYRDQHDFSVYMGLLADAGRWEDLDREFAEYAAGDVSEETQLLHVELLKRRERYDEALEILDAMTRGRPFNADLAYERMTVLDLAGRPAEVLVVAEQLIDEGYRSLQSYYYKGDAEYQLRSYRKARESFEQALAYSPANANIKEYLEAIDHMLGEGDTTAISQPIEAVAMPRSLQRIFDASDIETTRNGYGAVFLSRITGYDFDGGDIRRKTMYRKLHILNDNGVTQFSTLEFDFDPGYEQLYVNSLVVRDADGDIIAEGNIDTYYITISESGYEASTEKTVHLPVPSLAPGMTIEAIVTLRTSVESGTFPFETEYLSSNRPIGYSALFVTGKHNRIRYQLNGVEVPRKVGNALVFELQDPVAFRWEPLQPDIDQILPWVQLGTVSASWTEAGAEYLAKIEDKLDVARIADRAERLVDGVDSEARRIEILSAYVQDEIRYEAIEFGRRAYVPKTARETLRDRYGDCKDHAVLLYALLRAVGIDASLALVNLNQQIIPGLPNNDQFNHMIVSVETGKGRVFIDATDKDLRLGQLSPRSMGGSFALELGDSPDLIRMPEYDVDLTGVAVERVVEPRDDGYIDVTETARFTGYQAADLRGYLRAIETSEMQAALQRWIATRYSDAELTGHFVDNIFDAGYDLLVEIRYTLPVDADGSFDLPGFLEAYYLEFDRVADRRFPFEQIFPLRVTAVTSVKTPDGSRLQTISDKPDSGESRFGNWRREIQRGNGGWEMRFDYVSSGKRFSPEEYREFAEFHRRAVDAIEQPLIVQ